LGREVADLDALRLPLESIEDEPPPPATQQVERRVVGDAVGLVVGVRPLDLVSTRRHGINRKRYPVS
jgi:hypothetical protein